MFCCRGPPCLDEAEPSKQERKKQEKLITDGHKQSIHQFQHQPIRTSAPHGDPNAAKVPKDANMNRIRNMINANSNILNPHIKHVTNVQRDIHVKLSGQLKKVPGQMESSYKVIQIPRHQSGYKHHTLPKQQTHAPVVKGHVKENYHRTSTPAIGNVRLSEEFSKMKDNDSDNMSDQQRDALNELDDTLNEYPDCDYDVDMPKIIAEVLPYGQFEPFNMDDVFPSDSGVDSDEPSSRSSSVSNGSKTGIITSKRASTGSGKRKLNSVSFQLPEGHVDKPYAPMQMCPKPKPIPVVTPEQSTARIIVSGNSDMKVWHTGNNVYVENMQARRNSGGPFKGSFMKLFYGKYGETDINAYGSHAKYLTPTISEKVASFENLSPQDLDAAARVRANQRAQTQIVRRHTFR